MLWVLGGVLVLLWALGAFVWQAGGVFIHILLAIAMLAFAVEWFTSHRSPV